MDEEFALCWNNFQDNIQTGFQNLYDRGDLVDVTLAMDGKLLHAHKIVLAICSPYFQEMFNTNPCKHPIIILKDVSFSVMCELLQFMYQGVVNVKHTELSSFMKIAQMLQIKGLATAPTSASQIQKSPDDLTSSALPINTNSGHNGNNNNNSKTSSIGNRTNNSENSPTNNNSSNAEAKISLSEQQQQQQQQQQQNRIPISENSSSSISSSVAGGPSLKRLNEFSSESLSVYSRKLTKRTLSELSDNEHLNQNNDSMDHMNPDDVFLPPIPHISIGESPRFDLNNVKREFLAAGGGSVSSGATEHHHSHHLSSPSSSGVHHPTSPGSVRNSLPPPFNFEYNMYAAAAAAANKLEYPNDLHLNSDFTKGSGTTNHMDIPPGMLFAPGERWFHGKLEFMLSQRGKPLLVHDGHTFGIQYIRKDKKYWQCNLSRKFNCKARVTTTDTGEIIVTNNEHCHTEIRQHLRKDYQRNKLLTAINHTLQERLAANNSALSSSIAHNSGSNSNNNNNNSNSKNQSSNNTREDVKSHFINNRVNRTNDDTTIANPNNNSIWQPKSEMIPDISFK